jgi:hypothetical protein
MRAATVAALAFALSCCARPAAPLDYDPYDVGFEGAGFAWRPDRGDRERGPRLIALPAARRVTFRFNATSSAPCVETKSALRVFFDGELFRTVYLGGEDGRSREAGDRANSDRAEPGFLALSAPEGTPFEVFVRALVRVPAPTGGDGDSPAPVVWAIADGPLVLSGRV